jgi:hypothetical protein
MLKRATLPALALSALIAIPALAGPGQHSIDGTGNNRRNPSWGAAGEPLLRVCPEDYADGFDAPAGANRPSARAISNELCAQTHSVPNTAGASDYVWQWGQFLDHDIDLTGGATPAEPFNIPVPADDPQFDPYDTGTQTIGLNRSVYEKDAGHVRQQINQITAFIDASNVYGSDAARAGALRTNDGTGRLRTSAGNLLPFNVNGLPNAGGMHNPSLFLAGDVRANEQAALTAMHTLFVREHNFWAGIIGRLPWLGGDHVYALSRGIVIAEMQAITYNEFLPALLGPRALKRYRGYKRRVNPGISNLFSTASYRFGHSMLSPTLLRLDRFGNEIAGGHLALRSAFFNPQAITEEGGIEPLLRGMAAQRAQNVDTHVIDDVRNFLFGPPGSGGFDLASLNIQRGRDHGLASYNEARAALGLKRANGFDDVTSDVTLQGKLKGLYGNPDQIDAWVGGLAEDHVQGALVGPLVFAVVTDQFERLRDGDRFFYARAGRSFRQFIDRQKLSRIIERNSGIRNLQKNVFRVGSVNQ